jgi:hypothetical protein
MSPPPLFLRLFAVVLVASVALACSDAKTSEADRSPMASISAAVTPPSASSEPSVAPSITVSPSRRHTPEARPIAGVTMAPLPGRAVAVCEKGPPLEKICPSLVPTIKRSHPYLIDTFGRARGRFQILELAAGAPSHDFARNRPPGVVHIVLETGDPSRMIELTPTDGTTSLSTAITADRSGPVKVDAKAQGWTEELILAAPFPGGGAHGDHLIYRRRTKGLEQRISIHVWTPLRGPVQVLRTMVRSLPK